CLLQPLRRDAPDIHAHARHRLRQHLAVHEPIRLRVAADDGGGQQSGLGHGARSRARTSPSPRTYGERVGVRGGNQRRSKRRPLTLSPRRKRHGEREYLTPAPGPPPKAPRAVLARGGPPSATPACAAPPSAPARRTARIA